MHPDVSLIATVAAGFGLALVFGLAVERLKLPALVGYLLAGIVIGPATPGFVANVHIAAELSEIGVMLLMFGVGLHFSLDDLLAVRRIALPGAIVQMGVATVLGGAMAWYWGWTFGAALVFGLSLSCASTVVLLKALDARGLLDSMNGRIAVGWLVVEDLATVVLLVLLPPLAGVLGGEATQTAADQSVWRTIFLTLIQVSAFVALMLVAGRRVLPWILWQVTRTGSMIPVSNMLAKVPVSASKPKSLSRVAVRSACGALLPGGVSVGTRISSCRKRICSSKCASIHASRA